MESAFETALKHSQEAHDARALVKSESRSLDVNPLDPRWWPNTMNYHVNSGSMVSEETSMRISTVYACVRLLSWTQASLPWHTYERMIPRGKRLATDHPNYNTLFQQPNTEQTSFTFRSTAMAHMLLWGNAYAEIEFDKNGNPIALWPLPPWRTKPLRTVKGELFYRVTQPDGNIENFPAYRIWHVLGLATDGVKGLSVVSQAREALGLTLATEEFGSRFFGQGTNVGGVAEHPGKLSKQAHDNLRDDLQNKYEGLGRSNRLLLLEEGMKYTKVGIPPNDSQFLETRQFQIEEVCRWFGVQPHLVMDLQRATNNNIEHQGLEFVIYTMRPHCINWEQETDRKLYGVGSKYFNEFLLDGLMRGDMLSRYQAYAIARQWGWKSADDCRELENENPLPDGQGGIYLVPMNMVPADQLTDSKEKPALPAPQTNPNENNGLKLLPEGLRSLEQRKQSASLRQKTAKSYRSLFEGAAQRIVEREKQNVARAAKKHLGERSAEDFNNWLNDYYRDFGDYIQRQMKPVAQSLADAIHPLALEEVNSKLDIQPHVDKFVNDYVEAFTARYTGSSKGQLQQVVKEQKDGDAGGEVVRRLDEWDSTRPGKVAQNETVQLSNAIAGMAFAAAGVTKLRWTNSGSKECQYCQGLDGKVVGIDQPFQPSGSQVDGEGGGLTVFRDTKHPPLHEGCECGIMPEM